MEFLRTKCPDAPKLYTAYKFINQPDFCHANIEWRNIKSGLKFIVQCGQKISLSIRFWNSQISYIWRATGLINMIFLHVEIVWRKIKADLKSFNLVRFLSTNQVLRFLNQLYLKSNRVNQHDFFYAEIY